MNLYDIFMCPLESAFLKIMRKKLIASAEGRVLEIGAGTGANFKYYTNEKIDKVTVADKEMHTAAEKRATDKMHFIEANALSLPFPNNSFDTVVESLLLCSVDGEIDAIKEIYRVLKPGGRFIHIDHRLPDGKGLRTLFVFLAPIWRRMSKSCRIDKTYRDLIDRTGFDTIEEMTKGWGVFYGGVSIKVTK